MSDAQALFAQLAQTAAEPPLAALPLDVAHTRAAADADALLDAAGAALADASATSALVVLALARAAVDLAAPIRDAQRALELHLVAAQVEQ